MTNEAFDRSFWERRWAEALRESPEKVASRPPNPDIAERIEWVEGDLGTWAPLPARFDLVASLYVHVAGSVVDMVRRLGSGVAPGATLLLVGHRPVDPATGAATPPAGQEQISVEEGVEALESNEWRILVAEERPRAAVGSGVDAVVHAVWR